MQREAALPADQQSGDGSARTCLGCPAIARDVLHGMVAPDAAHECAFEPLTIESRQLVPVASLRKRGLALVRRGHLIRERVDASGARTAIDAVGPGGCFPIGGLADGAQEPRSGVYAVTRALICTCEERAIHGVLEAGGRGAVDLYVLEREAGRRAERLADARARGSSPEKVAALLCALADELRPGHAPQRIPVEFQHRDLAGLLSIRHESVCRILRAFERQRLIERDSAGIAITDRDRLERVGPRSARS